MATPIFHPLLQMIVEKAPVKKFNINSKPGDFLHVLEQNTAIWSKDALNQFLDLLPADEIPFAKNISRQNKLATISSWINKIFSDKQQMVKGVVAVDAKEFSAAELDAAVSKSNAALSQKVATLEKKLAEVSKITIKPAEELEKKRKQLEKSIQSQQLEFDPERH